MRAAAELTDTSRHAGLLADSSKSGTGWPMETTRTGSGYVSPKTARRPLICLAAASGGSGVHRQAALHAVSNHALYCARVPGPHPRVVREVEPESIRRDRRALLINPIAQLRPQREIHQAPSQVWFDAVA